MEYGKFETKPYIEAMKSEIKISYRTEITDIIKARRAVTRAQSGSSSSQIERQSITPEPAMRTNATPSPENVLEPSSAPSNEATSSNMALGK